MLCDVSDFPLIDVAKKVKIGIVNGGLAKSRAYDEILHRSPVKNMWSSPKPVLRALRIQFLSWNFRNVTEEFTEVRMILLAARVVSSNANPERIQVIACVQSFNKK